MRKIPLIPPRCRYHTTSRSINTTGHEDRSQLDARFMAALETDNGGIIAFGILRDGAAADVTNGALISDWEYFYTGNRKENHMRYFYNY